ncbi:unnamed protein product [Ixodes persulcatus]
MHYYNDEKGNDHGGRGLTGALVVKFIIMFAIMFIFFFAIIAYAMHKKKHPTDNSNVPEASPSTGSTTTSTISPVPPGRWINGQIQPWRSRDRAMQNLPNATGGSLETFADYSLW